MSITIRPLEANDREGWNPLWQGYLTFYKEELTDEVTDNTWMRLISDSNELMGFGAVDKNNKLIGFVHYLYHQSTWCPKGYCYLEDLFVDPTIRGAGLGEKLIKAVEDEAKAAGKTQLYWMTQHENFRARGLYNKVAGSSVAVRYEKDI